MWVKKKVKFNTTKRVLLARIKRSAVEAQKLRCLKNTNRTWLFVIDLASLQAKFLKNPAAPPKD